MSDSCNRAVLNSEIDDVLRSQDLEDDIEAIFPGSISNAYAYFIEYNNIEDNNSLNYVFNGNGSLFEQTYAFHNYVHFIIYNNNLFMDMIDMVDYKSIHKHQWNGNEWSKVIDNSNDDDDILGARNLIKQNTKAPEGPCVHCKAMNDKGIKICWKCGDNPEEVKK